MSKAIAIIGAQWGDEGKGKITDLLGEQAKVVVRFQGGHNAGHTVIANDKKIILHVVPSGIMRAGVVNVIGNGVTLSLPSLVKEITMLAEQGISTDNRLKISDSCNLLIPSHQALDQARENLSSVKAIGTTKRGIGPSYEDKAARRALRLSDLFHETTFEKKLKDILDYHNFILKDYYKAQTLNYDEIFAELSSAFKIVKPMVVDVVGLLGQYLKQGKNILFEGAQGTYLDIDHGTYPYVTSSNTIAGAVCTGCGFGPLYLDSILGIVKAYATRVGQGPFPTELFDKTGEYLRGEGQEFGATTGRSRRCGWLDLVMLKRAVQLNSFSDLCLTKLDVLDGVEKIYLCVAYRLNGKVIYEVPSNVEDFSNCEPVYEELSGWLKPTKRIRDFDKLPENAVNYIKRIAEFCSTPVSMISTGEDRDDIIFINYPFN